MTNMRVLAAALAIVGMLSLAAHSHGLRWWLGAAELVIMAGLLIQSLRILRRRGG